MGMVNAGINRWMYPTAFIDATAGAISFPKAASLLVSRVVGLHYRFL